MLNFPIVDSHLHIWDVNRLDYKWLKDVPELNFNHLPKDFDRARGGIDVGKIVFVQADCVPEQSLDEVDFVTSAADARIRAIVACASLEKGDGAREELDALAKNPLVKGVRRLIQSESDPAFPLRADFVRGVKALAEYGFTFDLGVTGGQLSTVLKLAERCPEVKFVIDHIGKPALRERRLEPWRADMRALAGLSNVYVKMSSLATEYGSRDWTMDDIRPFAEWALEVFGYERAMFGGDWPVSSRFAGYPMCVSMLLETAKDASDNQLLRLFKETAEEFYGI